MPSARADAESLRYGIEQLVARGGENADADVRAVQQPQEPVCAGFERHMLGVVRPHLRVKTLQERTFRLDRRIFLRHVRRDLVHRHGADVGIEALRLRDPRFAERVFGQREPVRHGIGQCAVKIHQGKRVRHGKPPSAEIAVISAKMLYGSTV